MGSPIVLSPCDCNFIHTVATHTLYMYMHGKTDKEAFKYKEAFLYIRLKQYI